MDHNDVTPIQGDAELIFRAGLDAVHGQNAVLRYCEMKEDCLVVDGTAFDLSRFEHIYVIGAGKASASMVAAVEMLMGTRIADGIVNVKYGHLADVKQVRLIEAAHPVPDAAGQKGAEAILRLVSQATEKDLVLCLFSGGGSALLPLPVDGVTLEEKQEATRVLLACGASIHEVNAVRKHISKVKGGRLARAVFPATLVTFLLSDVVGDDLDVIASGPTVPDSSSFATCDRIFKKYGIADRMPSSVINYIKKGCGGEIEDTPKPGDAVFQATYNVIVGSNTECILAAEKKAQELGYDTTILSTMIEGEAREVALVHCAIAKEIVHSGHPLRRPACVLSGGETTVTIHGDGKGGRNQEFALAAAMGLEGVRGTVLLSAGTDGTDGPTDAAGAMVDGQTMDRARKKGLEPHVFLAKNDAYHFFENLGELIITGPTDTNVMDIQILLVT